jgi:hypothetical protein
MSKARVDLPEPDTPVTTVNLPRGISTSMPLRLCSRAWRTEMLPLPLKSERGFGSCKPGTPMAAETPSPMNADPSSALVRS